MDSTLHLELRKLKGHYNYKGFHSIVLLALCDSNKKFIYLSVGVNGRTSDGDVYRNSCYRH